ncbi:hypothetical protein [Roseibacillus persicicus]|uniref:Uncharacterized protein n=2 Tax=Roseibacillus persicicus TaxID=454148 RepID=A0A918TBY8_9BACT|nr:hypothetical protein GCM10007100_00590 [Roseibacillus persicicus]
MRDRVLAAFELAKNGRGRRAYVKYLEERASNHRGTLSPEAMSALRRGWYLGDESFRDRLLAIADTQGLKTRKRTSLTPEILRSHGITEAKKIIQKSFEELELTLDDKQESLRKGDYRKVAIATLLKSKTEVTNQWITQQLKMGHENSVNRLIRKGKDDSETKKLVRRLNKMFKRVD